MVLVIISQYVHVSNHHAVHFNLHNVMSQLYLNKSRKNFNKLNDK